MPFNVLYHPDVKTSDLPSIDAKTKTIIKKAIENRLMTQPEKYGQPLRRTLKGYWKLRVSKYRVVYAIHSNTIRILAIKHRKQVYKVAMQRTRNGED
jgi:mRNA interferase RelE/StbE